MSGGRYDYKQFMLLQIAEQLNDDIGDEYIDCDIDEHIKKAVKYLKLAHAYVHEIDYLISGDTGCDSFKERLAKRLECIDKGLDYW